MQVNSLTVMTHVTALDGGQSSLPKDIWAYYQVRVGWFFYPQSGIFTWHHCLSGKYTRHLFSRRQMVYSMSGKITWHLSHLLANPGLPYNNIIHGAYVRLSLIGCDWNDFSRFPQISFNWKYTLFACIFVEKLERIGRIDNTTLIVISF